MPCARGCCPTPRDHWLSVAFSASATPTRRPEAVRIDRTEAQWDADMPAYKRLRHDGLQPKAIDGCAELESKGTSREEIEMGHLFTSAELPIVRESMAVAAELRESV